MSKTKKIILAFSRMERCLIHKNMKKQIIVKNEKDKVLQITTTDERWYAFESEDPKTKLPIFNFVPSVTWICESYPKGIGFYKWLADKGWDEAEAIKAAAGDKGSKVHKAIETLLNGDPVKMEDKFVNPTTEQLEELTAEEYEALCSFADWFNSVKPEILATEITVVNKEQNYAGTVDFVARIDGKVWLIDFKTSQNVWPSYELQVSAYKHALKDKKVDGLAILQIGYKRNKNGWKWNEVEDKFDLFLAAQKIWANDHGTEKPSQKDLPIQLLLELPKEEEKAAKTKKSHAN